MGISPNLPLIGRALLLCTTVLATSLGAYWSVRLAISEPLSTADSIADRQRAADLIPGDSRNWIRLAILQQENGMSALASFTRAAEVSPLDADAWIGIGLEQEISGDLSAAEHNLLHAAEVSHEYVPRWTLANFYFRRRDAEHFWPWAKQALMLGVGDLQPIFRMAWDLSDDAPVIERNMMPDRHLVLTQYLGWLTSQGKLRAAGSVSSRLLRLAEKEDLPTLQYYCDREVIAGHFADAASVWNGILARRLLNASSIPPADGVVDGGFTSEPLNFGFAWRVASLEGVAVRSTLPGLRVSFSGKQPEACEPLSQYVLLEPNRPYELTSDYFTSGVESDTGLSWRVFDAKSGKELTKDSLAVGHDQPVTQSVRFSTPADVSGARIALTYRRAPGTTRIEGWLQLKRVALRSAR